MGNIFGCSEIEERQIKKLNKKEVAKNAHRIYEFLKEKGICQDSVCREYAFELTSRELNMPYETLYQAWLKKKPISSDKPKQTQSVTVYLTICGIDSQDNEQTFEHRASFGKWGDEWVDRETSGGVDLTPEQVKQVQKYLQNLVKGISEKI